MPHVRKELQSIPEFKATHYKPTGKQPVCGAMARVIAKIDTGVIVDKYALLCLPATTDIERVTCEGCRKFILNVVNSWIVENNPIHGTCDACGFPNNTDGSCSREQCCNAD